jgi:DNA-binding transcriptional ArsR family regulator
VSGVGLDAVFSALADPTRRGLVARLSRDGPRTATTLAEDLPMTRQAVVHHLRALGHAGLVDHSREGREVRYRATPEPLDEAMAWMLETGARWDRRLQGLRDQLERRGPSPRR